MRYRLVVAVLVATFVASGVSFTSAESHPTEDDMNKNLEIHPDGDPPAKDEERASWNGFIAPITKYIPGMRSIANREGTAASTVRSSTGRMDDAVGQGVRHTDELVEGTVKAINPALQKAEQKAADAGVVAKKLKEVTKDATKVLEAKKTNLEGLQKSLMAAKQATKDAKAAEKTASAVDKKAAKAGVMAAESNEKGAARLVKGAEAETKQAGKALTKVGKLWGTAKTKHVKLRGKARKIEAGGRARPTKRMVAAALATVAMIFAALAGMSAMKAAANDKMVPLESMSGSGMSDSTISGSDVSGSDVSGSDMSGLLGL
uniref:RxLR effector candidate protein n=1 Tax=Hyaloperonospora arabidopsidis (strain Emoy2) TaxID=559515 RepID=M4BVS1_HYAAE